MRYSQNILSVTVGFPCAIALFSDLWYNMLVLERMFIGMKFITFEEIGANLVQNEISCFTADFINGKVTVGGKTFPSGYFFMNAMNEYWKPYSGNDNEDFEIAQRLMVMRFNRDKVQDELALNYLYPDHAAKLYEDVQYFHKVIARAKPFCFLDLDAEQERCRRIFDRENVTKIIAYLRARSIYNFEHDNDLPEQRRVKLFQEEDYRLQEFIATIEFYEELGQGMKNAKEIGLLFVKALESPEKRNESNLITMAIECIENYYPSGFIRGKSTGHCSRWAKLQISTAAGL